MRSENPQIAQPGLPARHRRTSFSSEHRIIHPVQLQAEKDQMGGYRGHPFLHRLVELAVGGIHRVGGKQQLGVRHHPTHDLLNRLDLRDRGGEARAGEARQFAAVFHGKSFGVRLGFIEITGERWAIGCRIKIGKVPAGQNGGGSVGHNMRRPVLLGANSHVG